MNFGQRLGSWRVQAREARYGRLAARLGEGEWLLTAHHQDDQLETVLLQLLRGAGPHGLAAMPALREDAAGTAEARAGRGPAALGLIRLPSRSAAARPITP